ncbi:MAG TPA: cation diffusion facilitator family transporter [Syntrophales bacterium]|nr:cation diffusion facilitator family transporter [Syntrophales bacterium]HOL59728.1 cation diffusion facilitator family transporter [Syntrophales bacterium]HPO35874.1 cation diffusion facilitator family transporter [Syntrophales bacterium]
MDRETRFHLAERIITISFWVNALLMVVKFLAGYFGNSSAVLADGVESAGDFIVIASASLAMHVGKKPIDHSHPYGHGKAEGIAAFFASLIITASGIGLVAYVITMIVSDTISVPHLVAVMTAALTIIVKEYLFYATQQVAKSTQSPALSALARDHQKDALTSIATLVGAGGAYLGWPSLDPLAAVFTSIFIFRLAWVTLRQSTHDLMDGQPPGYFLEEVCALCTHVPGVHKVHEIRARRSGQYIIIDLKLEMDPKMTVKESHDISHAVKRLIFERFDNVGDVMIHINPAEEPHEDLIRL